jgi:hypothetical protein
MYSRVALQVSCLHPRSVFDEQCRDFYHSPFCDVMQEHTAGRPLRKSTFNQGALIRIFTLFRQRKVCQLTSLRRREILEDILHGIYVVCQGPFREFNLILIMNLSRSALPVAPIRYK